MSSLQLFVDVHELTSMALEYNKYYIYGDFL
jgi:hypothetical protein